MLNVGKRKFCSVVYFAIIAVAADLITFAKLSKVFASE
jgi:hypothetical protein